MTIKKLTDTSSSKLDNTIENNKTETQNTTKKFTSRMAKIFSSKTPHISEENFAKDNKIAQNRQVSQTDTEAKLSEAKKLTKTNLDIHTQLETLHDAVVKDSPKLVASTLKKISNNSAIEFSDLLKSARLFDDIYDNSSEASLIAVVKFILKGNFSEADKIKMLSTNNINGKPILYNTFSNSKLRKCSEKIISLIINSNLAIENKIQLLQAKTDASSSWLYDMLQANEVNAVQSYASFILNTDKLTKNTKYALLTPINVKPINIDILAKNVATKELQNILAEKYPISYQQGYSDEEIHNLNNRKITKLKETDREYSENGDLLNYPSQGVHVNLNCSVQAFDKQDTRINGRKIEIAESISCRHLALLYAKDTRKPSELFKQLDSVKKLIEHPEFEKDLESVRKFSNKVSKTGYFFDINNFPNVMNKLILKHWGQQNYQERFIFTSGDHAMAIKIENKDNGKYTKVSFYDPNDTARQINTNVYKPEDIDKLTASFVANNDLIENHFMKYEGTGTLLSLDVTTEDNCETYIESDITPTLCTLAARRGHFKSADLGRQINSKYTADEIFSLYNFKFGSLQEAMIYTNHENLKYIIKSILESSMTSEQKVHLLANNDCLLLGLQYNINVSVSAFCNAVLSSNILSEEDKYEILSQKNIEGFNGLSVTFLGNNPESIREFTKSILTSNLTEETKEKLLIPIMSSEKYSAVNLIYASPESFHAFTDAITKFASEKLRNKIFDDNEISPSDTCNIFASIISDSFAEIEQNLVNMSFLYEEETTDQKLQYIINTMLVQADKRKDYRHIVEFLKALLANEKLTNSQKQQILNIEEQHLERLKRRLSNTSMPRSMQINFVKRIIGWL